MLTFLCTALLLWFLSEFCQRDCFAVFVFDVGVFKLLAEACAECGNIFFAQLLLFCLLCFCKANLS